MEITVNFLGHSYQLVIDCDVGDEGEYSPLVTDGTFNHFFDT